VAEAAEDVAAAVVAEDVAAAVAAVAVEAAAAAVAAAAGAGALLAAVVSEAAAYHGAAAVFVEFDVIFYSQGGIAKCIPPCLHTAPVQYAEFILGPRESAVPEAIAASLGRSRDERCGRY
jgi:hypothetical protein